MSLCTIVFNKELGFIGADTRVCSNGGREILGDYPKLQNINDKYLIFGSGKVKVCIDVFEKLKCADTSDIDEIHKIISERVSYYYNKLSDEEIAVLPRENGEILFQTFVIMMMNDGIPTVYQMMNCDDFRTLTNPHSDITAGCAGIYTAKAQEILLKNIKNAESGDACNVITACMQDEYNHMASNEIGGTLHIYEVSKRGIRLIHSKPIEDLYLRGHCYLRDGHIHMTKLDKTSKVDFTSEEFTIYKGNGKGDYEKSVYIDADGNAVFRGIISGSKIIGSDFWNKDQTTKLTLGMAGNLGDLTLTRTADGTMVFQVYDDATITTLKRDNKGFLSTTGGNTYMLGKWFYNDQALPTQADLTELKDRLDRIENKLNELEKQAE